MQFISYIPSTVIINIGFMAILYLVYETIKHFFNLSAKQLFIIAVSFEIIGLLQFAGKLFLHNSSFASNPFSLVTITSTLIQWNKEEYLVYLGLVYFLFLLIFILRGSYQLKTLNNIRSSANYSNSKEWNQEIQDSFQINKHFKIGVSNSIDTPITFGWLDPIILLPITLCNQLSIEEIKIIILHEIAHIVRQDYIIYLLVSACHTILYFNPISYLFSKEINIQREIACDSWVVAHAKNPIHYSKLLYTIANHNINVFDNNLFLNFISRQNELLIRIKHINQLSIKTNKSYFQLFCLIVLAGFTIFFTIKKSANKVAIKKAITTLHKSSNTLYHTHKSLPNKDIVSAIIFEKVKNRNSSTYASLSSAVVIKTSKASNENLTKEINSTPTTYSKIVNHTYEWLKQHENINQFAGYDLKKDSIEYDFAEKLVLRSILKSYQFKKDILNAKMKQASNQKEAYDFIMNSKEWDEIQKYEIWTKEFLQKHPGTFNQVDSSQQF